MKQSNSSLMVLVAVMFALVGNLFGAESSVPSDKLINCIIKIESSGNINAIGDKILVNRAYGPLQVRKPICDDLNRRYGTSYTPEQCLGNLALSKEIFCRYMKMYATKERLGRVPTNADFGRIWNGGPNGWKRDATKPYLAKIVKYGGLEHTEPPTAVTLAKK